MKRIGSLGAPSVMAMIRQRFCGVPLSKLSRCALQRSSRRRPSGVEFRGLTPLNKSLTSSLDYATEVRSRPFAVRTRTDLDSTPRSIVQELDFDTISIVLGRFLDHSSHNLLRLITDAISARGGAI